MIKPIFAICLALLMLNQKAHALDDHLISGEVLQKLDAGVLISGILDGDGRVTRTAESGVFYVKDCPGKIYDGLRLNVRVSGDDDLFSYTDVQGARRTIRAFTFYSFPQGEEH